MSNRNLHFKGQMEHEEVVTFFRNHWIALVPFLFPFLLVLVVTGVFSFNLGNFDFPSVEEPFFQVIIVLTMMILCYMIHRFFMHMMDYFLNVVIITNMRIIGIQQSLFTQDDKQSIDMKTIQDIQKQQDGLVKNLLEFGELMITLGAAERVVLRLVPNPDYHFRLLNRLRNGELRPVRGGEQLSMEEGILFVPEERPHDNLQKDGHKGPAPMTAGRDNSTTQEAAGGVPSATPAPAGKKEMRNVNTGFMK